MKKEPYLFAICGCKNSGKTTLISKIIERLSLLGYKVATIKHDGHDFQGDVEGTDTFKHRQHGAYGTAIFSNNKFMVIKDQKETNENQLAKLFTEDDIIILEGSKNSIHPKYEMVRKGNSKKPIGNRINLLVILSDIDDIDDIEKVSKTIDLNNTDLIVEDILNQVSEFRRQ